MTGTRIESRYQSPLKLESIQTTPSRPSTPHTSRNFPRDATIVLVGSRGSGKRSLGFIGATYLGRRLITEDHYFEQVTGVTRKEFISRYGNKEFAKKNVEVLQRMLLDNPANCIVECGMGSLAREAQAALREYSQTHPVIHVMRNPNRIRQLLKLSEVDAKRLEHADSLHQNCSNFEYYNLNDLSCERQASETSKDRGSSDYSSGLKDAKQDFSNFLDFITGLQVEKSKFESPFSLAAVPPEYRPYTYALNIRLSDLLQGNVDLSQLDPGGDVVELKIDIWISSMLHVIDKYVAQLRRVTGLPIIYHIDEAISDHEERTVALLHHGLRLAVDYLVISLGLRDTSIRGLLEAKGQTKIVGHWFEKQPEQVSWKSPLRLETYQRAVWLGCDLVRFVQIAVSKKDNEDLRTFTDAVATLPNPHPPLIAYNVGQLGTTSLVSNKIFTPVTHEAIKSRHHSKFPHDTHITSQSAMQALFQTATFDPLYFYIFGANVAHSPSPIMHNGAYRVRGMMHDFRIRQALELDELHVLSQDPHFGGAGISQPFKVAILQHLHAVSQHARAIGAVNTVLPLRALPPGGGDASGGSEQQFLFAQAHLRNRAGPVRAWYGDNTDWIGIVNCLRRNLSPRNAVQPARTTGLVVGAGGMARAAIYAMIQLGCRKIYMYNRTVANAAAVATHFNSWAGALSESGEVVHVLESRQVAWPEGVVMPTLIVSCVPAQRVAGQPAAKFEMPVQWLGSPSGGVVLEVSLHLAPIFLILLSVTVCD